MMGKMPNKPNEVNINEMMMGSNKEMNIENGLKQNLPQMFANLAVDDFAQ